ncbi:PREDICTED: uncharacterized protein LOC106314188 [Brassica oleracea var. oleracea]|uniref:uncharacterized protein LOC106314188 n=1 Tax=Brassica oleracea var. oleracea TaxID=109376 RepID=UPI0006A74562|nr:PREDICTED: uncharacterized protein LOC106314188 [Brassica oleracea var. oleracea]
MNTTKTELFTSRVDQAESAAIASYEFFSGQFPIRYLGLPLMSRKSIHLNNKSFWIIQASPTDSWAWKKLLDLRPLALQFCQSKLGNGSTASFWLDVWTPFGQLIEYIGPSGPRALMIKKEAVIADAIRDDAWNLPHPRAQKEVDLHSYLTTITLPLATDIIDEYEWIAADCPSRSFRSSSTREMLRPREETKDWVDVVWFKGGIPKHAFTMWVANYDRLPTRSRRTNSTYLPFLRSL